MNAPTPTKSMIGRSVLVAAVFCVLLVVGMGGMLFYHQIIKHDFYETRALEQQTLDQIITPARGTIYASDMQKLAYSVPCYTVVLSPATMKDMIRAAPTTSTRSTIPSSTSSSLKLANPLTRHTERTSTSPASTSSSTGL